MPRHEATNRDDTSTSAIAIPRIQVPGTFLTGEENETGGIQEQSFFQYLPRFDGRPGQRAAEDVPLADQPVLDLQEHCAHPFLESMPVAQPEVVRHGVRPIEEITPRHSGLGDSAGDLEGCNLSIGTRHLSMRGTYSGGSSGSGRSKVQLLG